MGLFDKVVGELIDIVQWLDDSSDTLVYRFERYGNEIKQHARLVVREGQMAVFVNQGQLADVFSPGSYLLNTSNLPVLATLQGWKYGFESPFKAEVYFCSTRQVTNLKWGTSGPCTMSDPVYGAVRVSAYGLYALRVKDPATFIREVVGTQGTFTADLITENLRGKIGTSIKEVMPEVGIAIIDLESRVVQLGKMLRDRIAPSFERLGLELTEVQVQDIGLPEELEKAIDKAGAMRVIGDMQSYTSYETASAIRDAANNPGGLAAAGVGVGMGLGMGSQMLGAMAAPAAGQLKTAAVPEPAAEPPQLPSAGQVFVAQAGQQTGPFDMPALQKMVLAGQLDRSSLVWKQGLAAWTAAGQLPELAVLFGAVPPPLPSI